MTSDTVVILDRREHVCSHVVRTVKHLVAHIHFQKTVLVGKHMYYMLIKDWLKTKKRKRNYRRWSIMYAVLIFFMGRNWYHSRYFMEAIFDGALAIEFLDGCPLFYKTPVSYLSLICEDRSMQTLELPSHTMSSVCPPSWCNLTLKSEPPKINKWNPNQKCYSPLDECQRGRMIRPDLILFPNHMMHSDN